MIEVKKVVENSIAEDLGLSPGDKIISINSNQIEDFLDLHYYEGDENIVVVFRKDNQNYEIEIEKEQGRALGIAPVKDGMHTCTNNCIFCFIKQNPPGMRRQIYVCDEDYRYSFLQGNFVTLTDADKNDLKRIVEQRLSPLYISVHATDPNTRRKLFQYEEDIPITEKLAYLADNNIEVHAQIVLVPGVNDGEILNSTIRDLYIFNNSIKSVAIVPVGLTKHRQHLPKIKPVEAELARNILNKAVKWSEIYRNNEGENFVYLADEIYLLAEEEFPSDKHYADYYQIENGVGLSRKWIDKIINSINSFREKIKTPKKLLFVSGELGARVIEQYLLNIFNSVDNLEVEVFAVENKFFGSSVTVSGLLTGNDIVDQVSSRAQNYDAVFLPPRCVNYEGRLLDNMTPDEIENKIGTDVIIAGKNIMEKIKNV
ncbi:MAG: DUF512 domain-containing protein [Candidatus Marinimicrobia bacterium]|nr:DUF512 domain-containing protein [Candidatus Neomarinimicrobiota bacterium]